MDNEELDIKPNIETIEMKVEDSESYLNAEEIKSMEWALEKYNKGQGKEQKKMGPLLCGLIPLMISKKWTMSMPCVSIVCNTGDIP